MHEPDLFEYIRRRDPGLAGKWETTDLAAQRPGVVHQLVAWPDETDAPLASLRAGQPARVLQDFTGETYADGEVTKHHGDTLTIAAGDEVPLALPRP
jgi:hypothetical protein